VSDKVKVFLVLLIAILLAAAGEARAAKGTKATSPDQGRCVGTGVIILGISITVWSEFKDKGTNLPPCP
jgi:hypothetical protein